MTQKLSLQIGRQVEGLAMSPPVQSHPSTLAEQSKLHLSSSEVLPSSQNSEPTFFKSPQISLQIEGLPEHYQPVSIKQAFEHPSEESELKSSHSSS